MPGIVRQVWTRWALLSCTISAPNSLLTVRMLPQILNCKNMAWPDYRCSVVVTMNDASRKHAFYVCPLCPCSLSGNAIFYSKLKWGARCLPVGYESTIQSTVQFTVIQTPSSHQFTHMRLLSRACYEQILSRFRGIYELPHSIAVHDCIPKHNDSSRGCADAVVWK